MLAGPLITAGAALPQTDVIAVIPVRWGSSRFPGKPLALLAGTPVVEHVWRRAREATTVDRVVVATDDARIQEAVAGFGGEVVMTVDGQSITAEYSMLPGSV